MTKAVFTADELAAATGGVWNITPPAGSCWSINTDSRTIRSGECFLPIIGEKFDGHTFLDKLPPGVIALSQNNYPLPEGLPVLLVKDTILAYQNIARFHRLRMPRLQLVAVTGSVGKTSVKEMLRAIFTAAVGEQSVLYTIGNTNNQIGVPQNLLRLTPDIAYAVIEMGTNHHGEIAPLSAAALPNAAIVNTIAACHLEHLGDLEGVAREKSAIYSSLLPDGCAIYPVDCAGQKLLASAADKFHAMTFGEFSNKDSDVSAEYLSGSLNGSEVRLNFRTSGCSITFAWGLTGRHQAVNAAAAAAAAAALNIPPEVIAQGLANTVLPGQRMNALEHNGCLWINDAYNANPQSMKSSLNSIAENILPDRQLLLVLGDMLELGEQEIFYHQEILEFVRQRFADCQYRLLLLGKRFARAAEQLDQTAENWQFFDNIDQLENHIRYLRKPGMTIFLKSSNSIGLSKVEPC